MTKLQSLNTRNVELRNSDLGDFADNQVIIYSFLDTARGEKIQQFILALCSVQDSLKFLTAGQ